jgi:hypothetical protein
VRSAEWGATYSVVRVAWGEAKYTTPQCSDVFIYVRLCSDMFGYVRITGKNSPGCYVEMRKRVGSKRRGLRPNTTGYDQIRPNSSKKYFFEKSHMNKCAHEWSGADSQSGRGLPQSKTWRMFRRSSTRDSVLECASPLALSVGVVVRQLISAQVDWRIDWLGGFCNVDSITTPHLKP